MVQKGGIIKVDFEAWTEDGELFDTTRKSVAKEAGKVNEEMPYEPMPVIVGVGRVIPGFDKALMESNVGEAKEITIPPEEAFGMRDPAKVETVSMREFQKQDLHPHPGMRVNVQNRSGTIVAVTAGRVRIDFNPPLAGKTLTYKFTIAEEVTDPAEQVKTLLDLDYGQGRALDFEVDVKDGTATIKLPESCKYDQRWFIAKYRLVADLRAYASVKTVRFVEEYVTEEVQPQTEGVAPEAGGAETESPAQSTTEEAAPKQ